MTAAELAPAASALTQAELAEQPAERFLGAHLAALRVAAVVLAHRTLSAHSRSRHAPSRPRDVWQVLAEVAPEYAEWAGFFAASALKRLAVQSGAVALVGTREADDLLRDVTIFYDQVAGRLRHAAAGGLTDTVGRACRDLPSGISTSSINVGSTDSGRAIS